MAQTEIPGKQVEACPETDMSVGAVQGSPHETTAVDASTSVADGMRYMARQPIMDGKGVVHGYELLFRAGKALAFSGDGDLATRDVLDQAATSGLEKLTGGLPVFVNCTHEALMDRLVLVLHPENTILELLETLKPSADLLKVCSDYKRAGYKLALDDFCWTPAWDPFMALADYIKIDMSITTPVERKLLIARVKGTNTKLVAERVETPEDLAMVCAEGFTLFQGYYFCKPVLVESRRIPENHVVHLEMLRALHTSPLDVARVSDLIKRDPSLTYKLLRMANSPLYGIRKDITSIRSALVLVGDEMFRRIATLAVVSQMKGGQSLELLRMAFIRGRLCELASHLIGCSATEQYLLGLLSLFPAMLHVPMESIANAMPLREEVRQALLGTGNQERTILEWLTCFEQGLWECCDVLSQKAGLKPNALPSIYAEAVTWAEENMKLVG